MKPIFLAITLLIVLSTWIGYRRAQAAGEGMTPGVSAGVALVAAAGALWTVWAACRLAFE